MQPSTVSICLIVSLIGLIAGDVRGGEKLGFFEAPFVHPGLIECLAGDLSDRHPSIVALDLEEAAIKRERQLKKWSHAKKIALIRGDFENLKRLSNPGNRSGDGAHFV